MTNARERGNNISMRVPLPDDQVSGEPRISGVRAPEIRRATRHSLGPAGDADNHNSNSNSNHNNNCKIGRG
jgi:hypothetical protein